MIYDGITIHRDWLEQARLMFPNDRQVARAILALLDYALYDKEPTEENNLINAFIVGLKKSVASQHANYARTATLRTRNTNTNTNTKTNTNTFTTSDKDEEERKILLERLKNQSK